MRKTGMNVDGGVIVGRVVLGLAMMFACTGAMAADEMGDGVCRVVNVLTGKWLFGFTLLATIGAGAALLFGAEISDGLKKIATIITVVGIIIAMSGLLSLAFTRFQGVTC